MIHANEFEVDGFVFVDEVVTHIDVLHGSMVHWISSK